MSSGKILLVGVALAGVAALVLSSKNAHASDGSALPPGWSPPPDAQVRIFPANSKLQNVGQLAEYRWRDSGKLGDTVLIVLTSSPTTFVAAFDPDDPKQAAALLVVGDTPLSKTLAQAYVVGLLA